MAQIRTAGDRSRIAGTDSPRLAAYGVLTYFRTRDKLHMFDEDAHAELLAKSRATLRRFGVDWIPDETDRADAERICADL